MEEAVFLGVDVINLQILNSKWGSLIPKENVGNLISLISGQFLLSTSDLLRHFWGHSAMLSQPTGWKGPKASTPFHVHETPSSPQSLPYKDASPAGINRPNRQKWQKIPSGRLTYIAGWNIPMFNSKYIFNPGPFSFAVLVYRRVMKFIS